MRQFNLRERAEIVELAQECSETLAAQPLIEYFNRAYTTKWKNGKSMVNIIIDKYYPDCNDMFRDTLHNMMLDFVFSFERSLEPPLEENEILLNFAKKLTESQIDIPSEFQKIVDQNFWDLFDSKENNG